MTHFSSRRLSWRWGRRVAVALGLAVACLTSGCKLGETARSRLPTSSESKLRREVSKQVEQSGFPSAQQTGAPSAEE